MSRPTPAASDEALVAEQFVTLTRSIPSVFLNILIMSAIYCGFIYQKTPSNTFLIVVIPLVAVCGGRALYWRNLGRRAHEIPVARKRALLRTMERLCMALCFCFASIVVYSLPASDAFVQSSIAILVLACAIAISLYLFVMPRAALSALWSASLSTCVALVQSDSGMLLGSAVAILAIALALTGLLRAHYENFRKLVVSRAEVEEMRVEAVQLAMTDVLTGLPNRRLFDARMKECARAGRGFAVALIDLDGFKPINDHHGHSVGDQFLIEAAQRMRKAAEGVLIARMGGDEFAILVENVEGEEAAVATARNAVKLISEPYAFEGVTAMLGASCGIALWRRPGDETRLVERADIALYRAKDRERGTVVVFSDELERDMERRAHIESGLREAIVRDDFEIYFQPIVEIGEGRLTGFEALARWTHPELGAVPPDQFIPIAEQCGLIEVVTDRLLRKAARIACQWPGDLSLSFNLSANQLVRPSAALTILGTLAECGLSPRRFEAEVTETAIMTDISNASATISALKLAGARVSLDDFGTGYSSFSELCELPLDWVKIDKSLIDKIAADERSAGVVGAIVKMCDELGLRCVAEGVETAQQMERLAVLGCDKAQGYLVSRPLGEADTLAFITSRRSPEAMSA